MDNIILAGLIKDFSQRHDLGNEAIDQQFEKFVNYSLLRTDHYDSFEFDKVSTGACLGVDGIAVSLGGVIVDEIDEARLFTKAQFEAKFTFSQAKTSPKFNLGDFLKFVTTVKTFFGTDIAAVPQELHKAFEIKTLIYERAAKLRERPNVVLAYVYTGEFELKGTQIEEQMKSEIQALRDMPYLFSNVTWHIHDGEAIARLYRETQNDVKKQISFQRHVALPQIRGARAVYLGVVSCLDYVKMIEKENGELNKGLFFENVRDFLGGDNPVNEEIAKTINDNNERDRFAILNNGVTIVAKNITPSGDNFKVEQFQVVNGCQTSHVLFHNRGTLTDDMYITVKLIETSDVDLSGKVIETTNSQSVVQKEAFATIKPYHRILEDFFNAMRGADYKYFYERRPHQYDDRDDVLQSCIVSAPSLIKSFVSVILEEPHKVHYYYGTLLLDYNRNRSSELFADGDHPGLYFAAHHISARTRTVASKDRSLRDWSFHLALLVKKQILPQIKKGAELTDRKFLEWLAAIDSGFDRAYQNAANIIKESNLKENQNRIPEVTDQLMNKLADRMKLDARAKASNTLGSPMTKRPEEPLLLREGKYIGRVKSVDPVQKKITVQYGPFFVVGNAIDNSVLALKEGDRVTFEIKSKGVFVAPQA